MTWLALTQLIKGDKTVTQNLLEEVPAVGAVARQEIQLDDSYSDELIGVVKYILSRAIFVLSTLSNHDYEQACPVVDDSDWREVRPLFVLISSLTA